MHKHVSEILNLKIQVVVKFLLSENILEKFRIKIRNKIHFHHDKYLTGVLLIEDLQTAHKFTYQSQYY